jgi:hypothetical protein
VSGEKRVGEIESISVLKLENKEKIRIIEKSGRIKEKSEKKNAKMGKERSQKRKSS